MRQENAKEEAGGVLCMFGRWALRSRARSYSPQALHEPEGYKHDQSDTVCMIGMQETGVPRW